MGKGVFVTKDNSPAGGSVAAQQLQMVVAIATSCAEVCNLAHRERAQTRPQRSQHVPRVEPRPTQTSPEEASLTGAMRRTSLAGRCWVDGWAGT